MPSKKETGGFSSHSEKSDSLENNVMSQVDLLQGVLYIGTCHRMSLKSQALGSSEASGSGDTHACASESKRS